MWLKSEKKIIVEDDGHGMSFKQVNEKFLLIGRNRRNSDNSQKSESGNRYVIGKKGLGKLSFFGIAEEIIIETIRDHKRTTFKLDWSEIKKIKEVTKPYTPELLEQEVQVEQKQGTKLTLKNIKRKSQFDPNNLAYSLSKSFQIFDEEDFIVKIDHNGSKNLIEVTNLLRYKDIE